MKVLIHLYIVCSWNMKTQMPVTPDTRLKKKNQ